MFRTIDGYREVAEIIQDGLSATFRCTFAICRETRRIVSVVCRLSIAFDTNIFDGFFHEIAFEIEVISLHGSTESFAPQNRTDAASFIPPEMRKEIIYIVTEGYSRLVELISPRVIYRVTKTAASLRKAIPKHDVLTRHLQGLGFEVRQAGTDRFMRRFWLMERRNG